MRGYSLVSRWQPATGKCRFVSCKLLWVVKMFVSLCCVLFSWTPESPPPLAEAEQWLSIQAQLLLILHNQPRYLNPDHLLIVGLFHNDIGWILLRVFASSDFSTKPHFSMCSTVFLIAADISSCCLCFSPSCLFFLLWICTLRDQPPVNLLRTLSSLNLFLLLLVDVY